ncbi:hypothetical protein [Pseudomonas sp. YL-218 TE3947]|uniref:hypothetical protein n=1 Tax=Pseudomonas TaxID=286 RepID=UPI003D1EF745
MAKPVLTLKKKKQEPTQAPAPELKQTIEDIPVNPLTAIEVASWDYTPEEEHFQPRQRKRRKDREVEQYRKESKWQ